MYSQQQNYKQKLLLRYLYQYLLKKNLKMKNVMRSIIHRLETNKPISNKQYLSIIKFIEREREFRSSNRDQIYLYFSPLIEKEKPNGNTLSEFLQQS